LSSSPEYFRFTVDRTSSAWLNDLFQLYCRTPVETLKKLTSVSYLGEAGVDGGGLSREFFHLTFNALIRDDVNSRSLWNGDRGHLMPCIDQQLVESRTFWFVGVLIAQVSFNKMPYIYPI